MAPTSDEIETQIQNAVALLDNLRSSNTVAADLDTFLQSLEGDFFVPAANGSQVLRGSVADALAAGPDVLEPLMLAYAKHVADKDATDGQTALDRMFRYFDDNNIHVVSRGFSFGNPTAGGSNVGDGIVRILTTDADGYDIENSFAETKTVECIADQTSGALRHEELFSVEGTSPGIDAITAEEGAGVLADLNAVSSNQSLLSNPSFESYTVSGAGPSTGSPYTLVSGDTITDWTMNDVTDHELTIDSADIYRATVGTTTPTAVRFNDNGYLLQTFEAAGITLDPDAPIDWICPTKRENSCDGTITVTWGSQTQDYTVSSLTNSSYNAIFPDEDASLWPRGFTTDQPTFKFTLASRSTGELVVDEFTFVVRNQRDGHWYVIHGGETPFLLRDVYTAAHTIASDSKIQRWLWRAFNRYLPHVPDATEITASGGRTLTFANSGSSDTITASSGSFITDGYQVGMKVTIAGTSSNNLTTGPLVTVTATVLTFGSDTSLANEGPLSSTATLNATAHIADPS